MNPKGNRPKPACTDLLDAEPRDKRRNSLRLGMMHYHLKSGGVVSVMRDIASALGRHSAYDSIHIDVIASTGSEQRARNTFEPHKGDSSRAMLRILNIPSLAYRNEPFKDRSAFLEAAENLAGEILEKIDLSESTAECPYILHSHNISLGKNPTATMAFKRIAEIAAERSLPLWLLNHVHDFAENNRPYQVKAFFTCTGRPDESFARSFMYPNGPNVIYLTINSADLENLLKIGISDDRVFLLPDPLDVSRFEEKPLWEMDKHELEVLGLPASNYREVLVKMLAHYASSNNHVFDASLPVLLSPLKVMRRKNNIESILLLLLFVQLGRRFQLLITLDANSPPDIVYSRNVKKYAVTRGIPVVIGFGGKMISLTAQRVVRQGLIKQFNMRDLHAICSALLTTSIVEGFGLTYHEGWLSRKPVIGRKVAEIVRDFEENGMVFEHMYERLSVSISELPNLRNRLVEAYKKRIGKSHHSRNHPAKLTRLSPHAIMEGKLFRAGDEDCVDFADLDADMQFELLDKLAGDPESANRFIDRNPVVSTIFSLVEDCDTDMIETNRAAVCSKYSLRAMARRLENLFEQGDSLYRKKHESAALTVERHAAVLAKYRSARNIRLLF